MNADILKALMQLFAILGKMEGERGQAREVVVTYLIGLLSESQAAEFISLYDSFSASSRLSALDDSGRKRISRVSVKVIGLCEDISAELNLQQRTIVVLRILEFMSRKDGISDLELAFFEAVASSFGTSEALQRDMLGFFRGDVQSESALLLSASSPQGTSIAGAEVLAAMQGELRMLYLAEEGIIAMRASGIAEQLSINGQLVAPSALHIISDGAAVRLGRLSLHYTDLQRHFLGMGREDSLSFEAVDISHTFKGGNIGIHPVTIRERGGTLVGIMGGSGAGKSTLVGILNGSMRPTQGTVRINGRDIHDGSVEGVIGFVSQDDLLIEELTVFDNLHYAARLCFAGMAEEELREKVQRLLVSLGLDGIAHLQVGGVMNKVISGGQRKRLNIALELIREPMVLFADEPTSGLSSSDSEQVIELLRQQAIAGRLVFVVIHQPSSDIFKRFDRLMLLDRGGYTVFFGGPLEAVGWFKACANHVRPDETECPACGNVNPEQVFNIIEARVLDEFGRPTSERKVDPSAWYRRFMDRAGQMADGFMTATGEVAALFRKPGPLQQYLIFLRRDAHAKLRNTQFLGLVLAVPLVLGSLLSLLMRNGDLTDYVFRENANIPAYIFISVIVSIFLGLMLSAEQIFRDRLMLRREAFINLSPAAYLLAKVTVLLGITAVQAMLFAVVGNTVIGLQGMLLAHWGILFATGAAATMMGLFISATMNSIVTIYITIPLIIIPQILLSGVLVKYQDLFPAFTRADKAPLVGELMVSKWAFEALTVRQFRDNAYERQRYPLDQQVSTANFLKVHWANMMEDALAAKDGLRGLSTEKTGQLVRDELARTLPLVTDAALRKRMEAMPPEKAVAALRKHFREQYATAVAERDAVLKARLSDDAALALRDSYTNDRLRELVEARTTDADMAVVAYRRIIPTYDPVYLPPDPDGLLRARLFSSVKPMLGRHVDTYWANLAVILLMAALLFPAVLRGLKD
jgi:ABC transport system ATP-binding/permease protein